MLTLERLKKLLGLKYMPPQVFKEHCAKLENERIRKKAARKIVKATRKRERMLKRADRRRYKKRLK